MRTFEDKPATRERTPLMLGLVGPSSSGKTFSAFRLATGIQRVSGGDIFCIDSEARRSLHYADRFKFRHVPFGAPFSPLDYLSAIEHCVKKGAGTIIIDSTSHEHDGPGGVLEMHEAEVRRMAGDDFKKAERVKMLAWQKPKMQRRRLINSMLQINCNFILCFRAKEKIKLVPGKEPLQLGFQPIAGEEFVYEMVLKCLLMPGANGVPTWQSDMPGEKMMIKIPEQFRALLAKPAQLSEDIGVALATWAAGAATPSKVSATELLASYAACSDAATFRALQEQRRVSWAGYKKDEKELLKSVAEETERRITEAERFADTETNGAAGETTLANGETEADAPDTDDDEPFNPDTGEVLEPGSLG